MMTFWKCTVCCGKTIVRVMCDAFESFSITQQPVGVTGSYADGQASDNEENHFLRILNSPEQV